MKYDKAYFDNLIVDSNSFYAHLPKAGDLRKPESLSEHCALVYSYAQKITESNNLLPVIKGLVADSIPEGMNKQLLAEMIEELFWQAIAYHDLGKINGFFQRDKMNNSLAVINAKHEFGSDHSKISVFLYLALFFEQLLKLGEVEQVFLGNVALYLSYPIMKHHSSMLFACQDEGNWNDKRFEALSPLLKCVNCVMSDEELEAFNVYLSNSNFDCLFKLFNEELSDKKIAFPLFALVKLNYSLLTASDYLATAHYMNNWKSMIDDYGIIDEKLQIKICNNLRESKSYNKRLFELIESKHQFYDESLIVRSNANLNALRLSIASEVVTNARKYSDQSLFYIEAPTGGGKTNSSMLAVGELLSADHTMQKVFYVFPFTTLITQTYQSVRETCGLDDSEIIESHSKSGSFSEKSDSEYLNYIDNMLLNFPVTLLSHVKFFDILKTNSKESNYLLHRIANSIVVLDEIQSYPPSIWDKMIYFISNYSRYFNIKFVLMSATLPKIGNLVKNNNFTYLISDKNKYFLNPNFCNRVDFDYSLLKWEKPDKDGLPDYLDRLSDFVFEKSQLYADNNEQYPNSVHTIIEFIYKNTASEFLRIVKSKSHCFDEIMLLSGTILEPRRREIINQLKQKSSRTKNILLITTQVVEAGVDIDMDLGFKDKSLIDSDEQLAGRINRNVSKSACTLYMFDCNEERVLYQKDDRYKMMRELTLDKYEEILNNKDFDQLYNLVISRINAKNKSDFIMNLNDFKDEVSKLKFVAIDESFKIINSLNQSVFVPIQIESNLFGDSIKLADDLNIPYGDYLDGRDVWAKYKEIIEGQDEDFVKSRILMKKLQGLMSMFTISMFPSGKDYSSLVTYGFEEYGFLYLESCDDIYTLYDGINTEQLSESNFL